MSAGDEYRARPGTAVGVEDARAALAEVRSLRKNGMASEALARCRERLQASPGSADLMVELAGLELERGQPEDAMKALDAAASLAPDRLDLWLALGDQRLSAGRFGDAVQAYRRAAKLEPAHPEVAARLGAALQSDGRVGEAVACYRAALERAPDNALLHYNLGTALKVMHRFDDAVEAYREAARLAPDNPDLKVRLGNLLVETSRFEQAIEPLNSALGALPRSARGFACHLLAYAHKKLGQGEAAVTSARQLVELTGGSVPALIHLSAAYLTLGDAGQALAVCERGLEREPASRQLLSDKAIALAELGREQDSRYLFDFDSLLKMSSIDAPDGYPGVDEFNAALLEHIRTHPTLDFSGISLSCHEGATSDELLVEPKGPVRQLEAAIHRAVGGFRAEISGDPAHPWAGALPPQERLELSAWVTRLRSQGYQHGHIHPSAWISGVYYVSLPPEVRSESSGQPGWIEFGRPPYYYACGDGHEIKSIRPREGMLVLFPSYFYHRTVPFGSGQERVTIAFDFRLPAHGPSATDGF